MKEVRLFYAPGLPALAELPAEESAHAARVLRMKEGDALLATDGRGCFYEAVLTTVTPRRCALRVVRRIEAEPLWRGRIELAVAPTKHMDRMEWLAEKATEIGLDGLSFLCCRNSERRVVKCERVERIVVSAMKQSHKARKPEVRELTDFDRFVQQPFEGQRFIAHCYDDASVETGRPDAATTDVVGQEYVRRTVPFLGDVLEPDGAAQVLVGPEGDFSLDEVRRAVAAGFRPVSLGRSRLRTETAALVAVHLMYLAKSGGSGA